MPRVTYRDFSLGLWVAGPRDVIPAGSLRRARGVRPFSRTGTAIRSRWGNSLIAAAGSSTVIHRILRFHNLRYAHAGNNFIALTGGGTSVIDLNHPLANGAVIRAASAIPTLETDIKQFPGGPEHLFIAGTMNVNDGSVAGGNRTPCKLSTSADGSPGRISQWGMTAPTETFTAVGSAATKIVILREADLFHYDDAGGNISDNGFQSTNKQEGAFSWQFSVISNVFASISIKRDVNLLTYLDQTVNSVVQSVGEDVIQLWVWIDRPENLDFMEVIFDVTKDALLERIGGGFYAGDVANIISTDNLLHAFSFVVHVEDPATTKGAFTGVADDSRFQEVRNRDDGSKHQFSSNQANLPPSKRKEKFGGINELGRSLGISDAASIQIVSDLSTTKLSAKGSTWTKLRIPKKLFTASGKAMQGIPDAGKRGWNEVRRVRFGLKTNEEGSVNMLIDEMSLEIGAGLSGVYEYAVTYKNSGTGSRSNPSKTVKAVKVDRQPIVLSGPALGDTLPLNVDRIEIWRTLGNGAALFKVDEVNPYGLNPRGKYIDKVADYLGVQEQTPAYVETNTKYLQDEALPFDNDMPSLLTRDVAGPYLGALWTLDGAIGKRGNVYFSPPGRMESVQDFIVVTGDDDPLQRIIHWNGIYTWSMNGVYGIEGTGPFIARAIYGIPGTFDPQSVIPTPYGIAYRAPDGARLFNGSSAALIAQDAISPIFNREAVGDDTPYLRTIVAAAYYNEEYIICDGLKTYAVNLRTSVWRECGYLLTALNAETDTGLLIGSNANKIFSVEAPGTLTDAGVARPFEVEVPGVILEDQSGVTKIIQRVYFDIDTAEQPLTATLIFTGSEEMLDLGTVSTKEREMIEISLGQTGDIAGIRLSGVLSTGTVEIAGVYYDVHLPEQGGQLT